MLCVSGKVLRRPVEIATQSGHPLLLLHLLPESVFKVLTRTIKTSLLREVHAAQQVLEPRIGA